MNWNEITGRWRVLAARAEAGTGPTLLQKVRTRYGAIKSDAGRQIDRWMTPRPSDGAPAKANDTKPEEIS